jgi:hypothetical protein
MSYNLDYMLHRLKIVASGIAMDWLSRLFEMMPVRGRLDLRCSYGAPWRIDQGPGEANEIPYHAVLAGSATLDDPGGRPLQLRAGDILLLPANPRHVMHDGSGAAPLPARNRAALNFTISENPGSDERLDLLCGHFVIAPPHDRLLRSYLPARLVVNVGVHAGQNEAGGQLAGLEVSSRWPRNRVWRRRWSLYSTSQRGHGRCRSSHDCATCLGPRSPANSRRSSEDQPAIS